MWQCGSCRDSAGDSRLDGGRTFAAFGCIWHLANLPTIKSRSLKRKADWNFVVNVEQFIAFLSRYHIDAFVEHSIYQT